MTGGPRGRRRPSLEERRAARAEVESVEAVIEAAARFLETRSRSEAEVRRRLTSAGYRPGLVEDAITRLMELGFLDDAAFATAWVESRDRARPRGERALRLELGQRGVARETIDAVLADRRGEGEGDDADPGSAPSAHPDRIAAEHLLARRRPALDREQDPRRRLQKAYALLARGGFDPDTCREVSRTILAPSSPEDDIDLPDA